MSADSSTEENNGGPPDERGRRRICTSLKNVIEATHSDLYHGKPAVEYAVAEEAWGSLAFRPSEVIALGAPPGTGKTAFVMQIVTDALRLNPEVKCLVANVEMTPEKLFERQLSRLSGIPFADIVRRRHLIERQHVIEPAIATLDAISARMEFMSPPYRIERLIDAMAEVRPELLIVDYLQRIQCCEGVADTRNRVNLLMQEIRDLASLGVSIVVVSAVGRTKSGGGYNANEIGLGSFRESSEIEYACDDAYVMFREGESDPSAGDGRRVVGLKHVKSRNHMQKDLRFEFDGAVQRFDLLPTLEDWDESEPDVVSPESVRRPTVRPAAPPRPLGLPLLVDPFPGELFGPGGNDDEL